MRAPGHRTKTITPPELDPLRINCNILTVPDDDQQVVFTPAVPDTLTACALRHLAAQAGPLHDDRDSRRLQPGGNCAAAVSPARSGARFGQWSQDTQAQHEITCP